MSDKNHGDRPVHPRAGLSVVVPSGYSEIDRVYGKLPWHDIGEDPGAAVAVDPSWIRAHIVVVKLPEVLPHPVYIHRLVAEPFQRAVMTAAAKKPTYKIFSCASFVPRHKNHDPKAPLSVHSWGAAVDLNPKTNRRGAALPLPPDKQSQPQGTIDWARYYDLPAEFLSAFKEEGFVWGGDFHGTKDAMHFQLAKGV